jgi:hypothetical protein
MFVLRIEWKRAGEPEHSMHECSEYTVQRQQGRTVITMDPNADAPRELVLDGAQVVYAMNEQGRTVDTIRN